MLSDHLIGYRKGAREHEHLLRFTLGIVDVAGLYIGELQLVATRHLYAGGRFILQWHIAAACTDLFAERQGDGH